MSLWLYCIISCWARFSCYVCGLQLCMMLCSACCECSWSFSPELPVVLPRHQAFLYTQIMSPSPSGETYLNSAVVNKQNNLCINHLEWFWTQIPKKHISVYYLNCLRKNISNPTFMKFSWHVIHNLKLWWNAESMWILFSNFEFCKLHIKCGLHLKTNIILIMSS